MRLDKSTLKKIKGDASQRSFYRKQYGKNSSIIVYSKSLDYYKRSKNISYLRNGSVLMSLFRAGMDWGVDG